MIKLIVPETYDIYYEEGRLDRKNGVKVPLVKFYVDKDIGYNNIVNYVNIGVESLGYEVKGLLEYNLYPSEKKSYREYVLQLQKVANAQSL